MSLTLTVDGERWRAHLLATVTQHPGIVPVAKGNGYGFGLGRLARRAQWLAEHADETGAPLDLLAIGTYDEIDQAATRYDGDLLVLTPWRPFGAALDLDARTAARVVHTVSRARGPGRPARARPRRPLRARAADLDAPPRHDPPRPRRRRGRRSGPTAAAAACAASRCTCRSTPPRTSAR